jgi:hypothetical protein
MIELLPGVDLELSGDVHVFRAFEYLRIDYVGDDRLILAAQIFIQQLRETIAGNFVFLGFGRYHLIPPLS